MTSSTKPFDVTKPVITRDGRKARIICTDRKTGCFPLVALIQDEVTGKTEYVVNYTLEGKQFIGSTSTQDLFNVPEVTRILVFTSPYCKYPLSQVLNDDLDKEPGELLIARKKAEGTFLKIIEVEL